MVSSRSAFTHGPDTTGPDGREVRRPELADVGRYGRLLVDRFVTQARSAQQPTFRSIIGTHLETGVDDLAVVEEAWPAFEHVNVQAALDAWLDVWKGARTGSSGWPTTDTGAASDSAICWERIHIVMARGRAT
ncbi:MAG: hypothetical protein WKF73_10115 [Nocardioidaceae bacterium]